MNNFIQAIATFLSSLFGGSPTQANTNTSTTSPPKPEASPPLTPTTRATSTAPNLGIPTIEIAATPDATVLSAQVASRKRIEHALVLPSTNFREWYNATINYTKAFERTVIIRSPAGNNLNRYKVVSAVNAARTWFNDDPLFHIRRAYPVVVSVDVLDAATPAQLKALLDERVRTNRRFGDDDNVYTRFTLDWMTDSFNLQIRRVFDDPTTGGQPNEGIDIAVQTGTTIRSAAAGIVTNIYPDRNNPLGYASYLQIASRADDGTQYVVTYTNVDDISVREQQLVQPGDPIGKASANSIKVVVQKAGVNTGDRYRLPSVVDPLPLIYVDDMTLHSLATSVLNVRRGQGTEYPKVGEMQSNEAGYTLEPHGITIRKLNTSVVDDKWINLDTQNGVTGYSAAWLLQARSPYSTLPILDFNGVNVDVLNAQGKPSPNRLGDMTYVRLPYNVSMGTGSQDLNRAFEIYAPYIDALFNAGKQIILVYTHQTFGEGAGYVWPQMTTDQWRELSQRYSQFVRQIAQQYQGKIAAHQIWNEQDSTSGRASVPMPPGDYAIILSGAIRAIRAVDATTPIITGGHNSGPGNGSNYARATLRAMPSDIRPDGIAFHPYGRGPDPDSPYAIFGSIDDAVQAYYDVMPGQRVWITEWGVLNAQSQPADGIRDYAVSLLNHLRETHPEKIAAAVWFGWSDSMDNGYGLVNSSGSPKEPLYSQYIRIK